MLDEVTGTFDATNKISYSASNDILTFEFALPKIDQDGDDPPTENPAMSLGVLAGENTTGGVDDPEAVTNHPQAGITEKGQRLGIYAAAVFSPPSGGRGTINSSMTTKRRFSAILQPLGRIYP